MEQPENAWGQGPLEIKPLDHYPSLIYKTAHFRGTTASASLKHNKVIKRLGGIDAISEAQRPRPH